MNKEERKYLNEQEDSNLRSAAHQTALRAAAEHKERTVHNEDFLNELRKADLDSDTFDWIEEEYPSWFSGAHAVTNRGDEWDLEADLIMQNKRERAVAESRPGRLLRGRPFLLASMRGDETPQLDAYDRDDVPGERNYWADIVARGDETNDPVTSEDMSRIYGAAEVAADLMSLSRNAAGLESVSTVKTETNVRRQEEDESTATRIGKALE